MIGSGDNYYYLLKFGFALQDYFYFSYLDRNRILSWQFVRNVVKKCINPSTFSDNIFLDNTFSDNTFSDNTFLDHTFSDNTFSDNTFSDNTFSDNTFSDNTVSDNTFSDNTFSDNTFSDNTLSHCCVHSMFVLFFRYVVGVVFGAEHVLIICVVLSHYLISDTPNAVKVELARRDYIKNEELKVLKSRVKSSKNDWSRTTFLNG